MKRVVDCCSAFKWVVTEDDSDKALRLRKEHRSGVCSLISPDIFPSEMASSLLTAQRKGRIASFAAPLYSVLAEGIDLYETTLLLPTTIRIVASITSGMLFSLYDCLYIALAEHENCERHVRSAADQRLLEGLPLHRTA